LNAGTTLAIADEYEALVQFLYLAPIGLAQLAIDGEILFINPLSAQLLMPLSRDGNLANLFTALESVAPQLRHVSEHFAQPRGMICDGLRIQVNAGIPGKSDPQVLSLSLVRLDATRLMAVLSDVTLQVKRERLLRKNEAWLNAILTGITDYAVVSLDGRGRIDDWNVSIGRVTGFERDSVLGRPYSIFYPPDAFTTDRVMDRLHDADQNGWSIDDGWLIKSDGTPFWGNALIAPLNARQDPAVEGATHDSTNLEDSAYYLVIRDISDKREAINGLRNAMSLDPLTGVANRQAFFDAAEDELEHCKRSPREMSIVLIDADNFKSVNDTHGHPAGDAVLRKLAASLTAEFRQVDVVARVGGEEFAVLLPSTGHKGAMAIVERLRQVIESQTVRFDGADITYTISGGLVTTTDGLIDLDTLMKRADQALYAAKAAGRNRIECWTAPN
jgi:diguanylate cyclase (GGDEF)-like protein/PAS domain S-box-containing protein